MISLDFKRMVEDFKTRPAPGKHAYVWNDDKSQLFEFLDKDLAVELDMIIETVACKIDGSQKDVRREIEKILETRLSELYSQVQEGGKQQVLVITSPSVLARYRLGLTVFYNYYLGDRTMAVFIVPRPKNVEGLTFPGYVQYDPEETLKYLASLVGPENVVEAK
jgi:hypothetical protein